MLRTIAVLTLIVLVVSGCGGGSSKSAAPSSASSSRSPAMQRWIDEVGPMLDTTLRDADDYLRAFAQSTDPSKVAAAGVNLSTDTADLRNKLPAPDSVITDEMTKAVFDLGSAANGLLLNSRSLGASDLPGYKARVESGIAEFEQLQTDLGR